MDINWQPIQIEKPKSYSAKEMYENMLKVREGRRKQAIDEAIRKGVGPDGKPNEAAIRQSLAASGFGENADEVVRSVYTPRREDMSATADFAEKLNRMSEYGIVSPDRARELFENYTTQQEVPQIDTSWAGKTGTKTQPTGSPGQVTAGTTITSADIDGTVRVTANPMKDTTPQYETVKKTAQAVPEYGSDIFRIRGPIETGSYGEGGSVSASPSVEFIIPTSGADRENILKYAAIAGYGLPSSATSKEVKDALLRQAESMVPQPVLAYPDPKEPYKARNDYLKARAERPALVAQKFQELKKELETGAQTEFTKGVTKQGETRAEEQLRLSQEADKRAKEAEAREVAKYSSLSSKKNPLLRKDLNNTSQLEAIQKGFDGLDDFRDAVSRYTNKENPDSFGSLGSLVDIATATLKANGQPATMDAVETFILKTGAVPKASELKFKKALRDLNITDLGAFALLDWSKLDVDPKITDDNLWKQYEQNIKSAIYRRGGKVAGYKPTAADSLRDMAGKGIGGGKLPPHPGKKDPPGLGT